MAPVDSSPAGNMGGFELVCSLKSNDLIPVHKYKSTNTGLTVVIAEVDGPVVNGYFCLATEAYDDDGLPHTLEHLIFLGSEKYPYKGVLDLLANRCLASGTNAWTDTDHTCYTMTTAGSEGFLSLMPIFLEHILYPTLTESGFITEVHHVTGEGEDAGIVYCEMQGRENIGESLTHLALSRAVYPGHCGYKSETGGIMKNLRESTNNDKVRKYHKEFYRPENLTVIITGQVKHVDVFKALQSLEEKIISKGDRGPYTRPWQKPVPPLTESVELDILYPCDDEDNGMINVGWRGPSAVKDLYNLSGCSMLLKYLTDNSVSPLQKEFVEISDPYASKVGFSLAENAEAMLYLIFENVPKAKIPLVKDHLVKILKGISSKKDGIDMKRLGTVIHRHILETLSNMENSPHDAVAFMVIGDFLYGNSKEDLDNRLNQIEDLKKLGAEPESYWINLLNKYFINAPMVVIKGIPSQEKQKEMAIQERDRIAKQIENLGKEGLQKKEQEVQAAMVQNERPIPDAMLTSVPIPTTDSINFHHIKSYTTDTSEQHPRMDVNNLPLYTYLDHVNTNFVYMFVIMDTSPITTELRPYTPLLLEAILESPVKRDGVLIPYEQVVAELEADTIATSTRIGFDSTARFSCGAYSHSANFMLQLEPAKYAKGVQWIKELLYETEITVERLKIIAAKIVNDVAQVKRKGSKVVGDLMKSLIYRKDSNHFTSSMLRQQKFLTKMLERLNSEKGVKEVIGEIESVRKILTSPDNMVLYMAMNVDKLATYVPDVYAPWGILLPEGIQSRKSKLNVTQDWALMNPLTEDDSGKSCVTGLGCIESAFFCQCSPGIKDFQSPDLAALLVFLQYLTQLEGPMWRQIRGQGLSYGYNIFPRPNEGLVYLTFFKSTNIVAAYREARAIVESQISGKKWEQSLYESAKSSLIFEIIEREKSVGDMVAQSLLSYFKDVPHDYNRRMVQLIAAVTLEDMNRVGPRYIKQLFDPKQCKTTIVCHPSKAAEVASGLQEFNHDLKVYNSLEESHLNICSPAGNMGGFELVCSLKSNDLIPVHKYKSTKTGLTVVIAEVDGPVVNGYFCLATETFDDDGLPHTLEHLIFLGSEKYPYKGVLLMLANRCLESGTNAWTNTDHTCYTMTTAGSEGFLSLMPIYLEHILYPTLTESGFITEVHHVTGEGEDAGIVYCEMQGTENIGETLTHRALSRAVYPGHCGYKSETGGIMKNLRESTNNDKVRKYHKEFYRPENLTVIITGQVKHVDVFKALQSLEEKIISKGDRGPYTRPWQKPVPPLTESVELDILYPCDDEDNGMINVGWRGPSAVKDLYNLSGCSMLLKYLTDNSVSPLQKEFVEISDPYASKVGFSLAENAEAMLYLIFENVPKAKISLVKDHLVKILKGISSKKDGIDMKRLGTVIHRHILETLSNMENSPHDAVAFMVIGDFLYGNSKEDLDNRLNQIEDLKMLGAEPESYWINLLNKYFIDAPMVVIKGIPSQEKQKEMAIQERDRIAKRIENLGKEGLQKKEQEVQAAMVQNERPILDAMLPTIPIPTTDSINFHHIKSYTTDTSEQHARMDVNNLPLYTYLDHVNTNFVYMFVIMDTSPITTELRPYTPLLLEAILESPVKRDGVLIPYEQVVAELEADTIATSTSIGFDSTARFSCGAYSHSANFMLQLEPAKYAKGVQWIKELLYETEITVERLKIIAAKIVNDVAQVKRDGRKVVGDLMNSLIYRKDSNHFTSSMLRQQKFLTKMLERLNSEKGVKEVIGEIESVRKILTSPDNMVLYMAMNVDKLATYVPDVYAPWGILLPEGIQSQKSKLNVTQDWALMNPLTEDDSGKSCVTGLGCIESAFFCQCSPGIKDFQSPDLPALLVFLLYLTQLEGPMWKQIRGQGLSYSYNIFPSPNEGLLYLTFSESTNIVAAYREARAIVESLISGKKWEQSLYESAKSSLIFEIIEREKSVGDMVAQSLLSYFKDLPHDYNRRMVQLIAAVTLEDMNRVGPRYVKQLFDPKQCKTTIVCHPSKAAEVASGLQEFNHDLKVYNSLEESHLNICFELLQTNCPKFITADSVSIGQRVSNVQQLMYMANQHGATMQTYNSELMKCVDELKVTRTNIQSQIDAEEEERNTLQKDVERMTYRIGQLNDSLAKKAAARNDYDRTIQETESAYTKILESSQLLLNMVKREATCLDQTLHAAERTERV